MPINKHERYEFIGNTENEKKCCICEKPAEYYDHIEDEFICGDCINDY